MEMQCYNHERNNNKKLLVNRLRDLLSPLGYVSIVSIVIPSVGQGLRIAIIVGLQRLGVAVILSPGLRVDPISQGSCRLIPPDTASLVLIYQLLDDGSCSSRSIGLLRVKVVQFVIHPVLADVGGVAPVGAEVTRCLAIVARHHIVYPTDCLAHRGINTRSTILTTANTPGNNSSLDISIRVIL